ncbi:NAD(+)/NADH kinase [Methanonatronarchaeum sp. AMET-Sl]|uniref:NAD(+)/NADH kinase n=1 Tax=Methanonatronarchaeum sp. AMET-Sl TaxID=3037654 RepID=UPI00244DFDA4|nr:NAD(+)/NADH kinase [Methanonatronarchaeum sp. AMET-Sl]WGI17371.1 NAD(+)/NADH kinase [Methanonatronarchaeum sp. AMET-Sl]
MFKKDVNKVGIIARYDSKDIIEEADRLFDFLKKLGLDVVINQKVALKLGIEGTRIQEMTDCDLVITIGGDGTILRTFHELPHQTPIVGINKGEVGFLTDLEVDNYQNELEKIIKGFEVDKRTRLEVDIDDEDPLPPATNEVVLLTSEPAKMLKLRVLVDGQEVERFGADGIIIATPTGSTAYSMSAGGPIVDPRVEGFLLVPIAPYKLSARSIVVPSKSNIKIELIRKGKHAKIIVDGQKTKKVKEGDIIKFREAKNPALFVKVEGQDFYSKIKEKLM